MLIRCSECGGNVSDKAPSCPHCGAPLPSADTSEEKAETGSAAPSETAEPPAPERETRRIPVEDPDEAFVPMPDRIFSSAPAHAGNAFLSFMKFCFLLLAFLIVCAGICLFLIRSNVGGITDKLRAVAESDSGDGSHIDRSTSRMMFKFHLAAFLDAVQGRGPDRKQAEPLRKPEPPSEPSPESLPRPKQEREPLNLPPPPPENI